MCNEFRCEEYLRLLRENPEEAECFYQANRHDADFASAVEFSKRSATAAMRAIDKMRAGPNN